MKDKENKNTGLLFKDNAFLVHFATLVLPIETGSLDGISRFRQGLSNVFK